MLGLRNAAQETGKGSRFVVQRIVVREPRPLKVGIRYFASVLLNTFLIHISGWYFSTLVGQFPPLILLTTAIQE
jgi:hypothetical protein